MAEYHVGCGAFGIYAGTLNSKKNKTLWQNKTECTDEALRTVRDYMIQELLGGTDCSKAISSGYEWTFSVTGMKIIPLQTSELKKIVSNSKTYKELYPIFEEAFNSTLPLHEWYNTNICEIF